MENNLGPETTVTLPLAAAMHMFYATYDKAREEYSSAATAANPKSVRMHYRIAFNLHTAISTLTSQLDMEEFYSDELHASRGRALDSMEARGIR